MNLIFIHGANATRKSFAYILRDIKKIEKSPVTSVHYFNYDHSLGFSHNFPEMAKKLYALKGNCMIIAHSMGGIYATHLYNRFPVKVKHGITIATPYLGLGSAIITRWLFPCWRLLQDVSPTNWPVLAMQNMNFKVPWVQLVPTKGGNPWVSLLANDGVVSKISMTARKDVSYFYLDSNHYEVLLDKTACEIITDQVVSFKN